MGLRISTLSHVRDKTKKHLSLSFQFKKTFQVGGPCIEIRPSKLTNQSAHTDREILVLKSFLSIQFVFYNFSENSPCIGDAYVLLNPAREISSSEMFV